jgi:hypothetical protein
MNMEGQRTFHFVSLMIAWNAPIGSASSYLVPNRFGAFKCIHYDPKQRIVSKMLGFILLLELS